LLYLVTGISRVEPSVLGKATIWIQSIFIVYVLIEMNFLSMPVFHNLLRWVTAGITITSGLHYIYRGLKPIHAI
jgi:phosphatidylglycerophosphate synthase